MRCRQCVTIEWTHTIFRAFHSAPLRLVFNELTDFRINARNV
jgi:hypothetical protein